MKDFLEFHHCQVETANTLSSAEQILMNWVPEVILIDFHIPNTEHWKPHPRFAHFFDPTQVSLTFCKQIKAHKTLRSILVFFISTDTQEQQKTLARQAGADGYFIKPMQEEYLERILGIARRKGLLSS